LRWLTISRNANITCWRLAIDVSAHTAAASTATATACSTSPAVAMRTSRCTEPSAGLNTSPVRSDSPGQAAPPTQWSTIAVADRGVCSRVVVSVIFVLSIGDPS
jgi:hypothetical protein